jgi:hypothetical protein
LPHAVIPNHLFSAHGHGGIIPIMFNRKRTGATYDPEDRGAVATADPDSPATDRDDRFVRERRGPFVEHDTMAALRAHQRDRFGGFSWGSDLLGWLAAAGLAGILAGIVAAAGAALGLTKGSTEEIGLGGGIALIAVLFVSYIAGGYAAGRMARFDGARQGFGVWLWGILIAGAVALLAVLAGQKYNVLDQLNLPRIPVDQGTLTRAGAIALAAGLLASLIGAVIGGTMGARWHRRVDRTVIDDS